MEKTYQKFFIGTIFWFICIALIAIYNLAFNPKSTFNDWGDFLAGFISPLAFGWLAYGIIIQKKEFESLVNETSKQNELTQKHLEEVEGQYVVHRYNRNVRNLEKLFNALKDEDKSTSIFHIKESFLPSLADTDYQFPQNLLDENIFNIYKIVTCDKYIRNMIKTYQKKAPDDEMLSELNEEYKLLFDDSTVVAKQLFFAYCFYIVYRFGEDEEPSKFSFLLSSPLRQIVDQYIEEEMHYDETAESVFCKILATFEWNAELFNQFDNSI